MYLWGRPTACSLGAARGCSLLLHHPQTLGMCLSMQDLVCGFASVPGQTGTPLKWLFIQGWYQRSREEIQGNVHWRNSSGLPRAKRTLRLQTVTKKRLHPMEREKSKMLSPVFLFRDFHKADVILSITPNFTLALKPENPYVRRGITEYLGRCSTSALLFYKHFSLQSLIYDLCRNPHLNPNLAFNHFFS